MNNYGKLKKVESIIKMNEEIKKALALQAISYKNTRIKRW